MKQTAPHSWTSGALAAATVTAVAALVLAMVAVARTEGDGTASLSGIANAASSGGAATLTASLSEFAINPDHLEAPAGAISIDVTNDGAIPHTLALRDADAVTPLLDGGGQATLDLGTLVAGTYELYCNVPGHADAGMKATLTVTEGGAASPHGGSGSTMVDYAAMDKAMAESIAKFPAETAGRGAQVLKPKILDDGTKQFDLTAEITDWEVEPGRTVQAWTYNGQVPGPTIRLEVGDKAKFVIHNKLPMGTDVHWHGVRAPNDQDGVAPVTQKLIAPGETFAYEFTVTETAVGMYHAHHHAQLQVINGMLGTILVGRVPLPEGRTISGVRLPDTIELADEQPMVLNDAGEIGYSLNGKSFPATAPFVLKSGQYLLVHYLNEGLQIHPMHLHGFRQLVIARDGIPLDQPYYADTIGVAPGERYSVLIQADQTGTWVWHCHILNHVEREEGMFGMVTALVVQ